MPDFEIEDSYLQGIIAGVDEVGVGPWAGPVVAAAVIVDRKFIIENVNDSKKLTAEKRDVIYRQLIENCEYGIGIVSETVIDEINILNAAKLAMKNAVLNLKKRPTIMLIDGRNKIEVSNIIAHPVIKGDSKSYSIAAASIIAKITRDKIMVDLHNEFPHYSWHTNAGYGTKAHQIGLAKHGICKYHRKSYAPIKQYING